MELPLFQVDAFTDRLFAGNPAAVCPLETWPEDSVMLEIAAENNLAETAFFVHEQEGFHIRWFTPSVEVDLCGHATLAAAHVLYNHLGYKAAKIQFVSRSGLLAVTRSDIGLTLDFPIDEIAEAPLPDELIPVFGTVPDKVFKGRTDYLLVFGSEDIIAAAAPDLSLVAKVPCRGIIITAPGKEVDFVSRFFAPQSGIPEDPVTGSTHTTLTLYWAEILGKTTLNARQLSKRGGALICRLADQRVKITGQARTYLKGTLYTD